jgi:hypothetical protein
MWKLVFKNGKRRFCYDTDAQSDHAVFESQFVEPLRSLERRGWVKLDEIRLNIDGHSFIGFVDVVSVTPPA